MQRSFLSVGARDHVAGVWGDLAALLFQQDLAWHPLRDDPFRAGLGPIAPDVWPGDPTALLDAMRPMYFNPQQPLPTRVETSLPAKLPGAGDTPTGGLLG